LSFVLANLALVPFLDLLNHSDDVTVEAGINLEAKKAPGKYCYEIRVRDGIPRHNEAFICYGKHNNTKLYTEYGFYIVGSGSEHIPLDVQDLVQFLDECEMQASCLQAKLHILNEQGLSSNLGLAKEISWNLRAAFHILLLPPEGLGNWQTVYDEDEFPHLNSTILSFIQHFHHKVAKCLSAMRKLEGSSSKYFHLAVGLVSSHLDILHTTEH